MVNDLFDAAYYLEKNPDVASANIDPYRHYMETGWKEGRNPSALFNTSFYLKSNPDVAASGVNPLQHFWDSGVKEGRNPSLFFNTNYYLQNNPDVVSSGMNPLLHAMRWGAAEKRNISSFFNANQYLSANPDVAASGLDPLTHFLKFGIAEYRSLGNGINLGAFLQDNAYNSAVRSGNVAGALDRIAKASLFIQDFPKDQLTIASVAPYIELSDIVNDVKFAQGGIVQIPDSVKQSVLALIGARIATQSDPLTALKSLVSVLGEGSLSRTDLSRIIEVSGVRVSVNDLFPAPATSGGGGGGGGLTLTAGQSYTLTYAEAAAARVGSGSVGDLTNAGPVTIKSVPDGANLTGLRGVGVSPADPNSLDIVELGYQANVTLTSGQAFVAKVYDGNNVLGAKQDFTNAGNVSIAASSGDDLSGIVGLNGGDILMIGNSANVTLSVQQVSLLAVELTVAGFYSSVGNLTNAGTVTVDATAAAANLATGLTATIGATGIDAIKLDGAKNYTLTAAQAAIAYTGSNAAGTLTGSGTVTVNVATGEDVSGLTLDDALSIASGANVTLNVAQANSGTLTSAGTVTVDATPTAANLATGLTAAIGATGIDVIKLDGTKNYTLTAAQAAIAHTGSNATGILTGTGTVTVKDTLATLQNGAASAFKTKDADSVQAILSSSTDLSALTVTDIDSYDVQSAAASVTLKNSGNVLTFQGSGTLIGGAGNDVITVGDTGTTMSLSGIETLIGGTGTDAITVTSGSIRFQGGTGDSISLASGSGTDTVVYSSLSAVSALGANTGFLSMSNFQSGTDKAQLTGLARSTADKNSDSSLTTATSATNGVSMTNELVSLSSAVSGSLTDASLANFRVALGTLTNSSAGASILVLANNGTSSGLYQVLDSNGDGQVAAGEVRLLGLFNSTVLSLSDVNLG